MAHCIPFSLSNSTPAARHCLQPHAYRLQIVCTSSVHRVHSRYDYVVPRVHNLTPSVPPHGQGYFYSRNCLREVKATVKYGKPVVFVHEEDEARGGAPVEELALQCPAEYRRYLFESHFKIIPCSRILEALSWRCHSCF